MGGHVVENSAMRVTSDFDWLKEDQRSVPELVAQAIADAGEATAERDYGALAILHARGTREVLDAGLSLCASPDAQRRMLGAQILGELGSPDRSFPEECCDALIDLVRRDPDESVVAQAVFALGHLQNKRCEPDLVALKTHPHDAVRHGVAFALAGSDTPEAIATLLELMNDRYELARDWATTGIGGLPAVDGPAVREALLRRATDPDDMTRLEALNGLARRRDPRVVPLIIGELEATGDLRYLMADAARIYLDLDDDAEIEPTDLMAALKLA